MDDEWINQPRHQIHFGFLRFLKYINQPKIRLLKQNPNQELTEPTFQLPKKLRDWWILSWNHLSWPVKVMISAISGIHESVLRCGERGTWYPKQLPSLLLYKNQPAMVASQHRYLECFLLLPCNNCCNWAATVRYKLLRPRAPIWPQVAATLQLLKGQKLCTYGCFRK